MCECDLFLCYRRAGAQTAKLMKRYMDRHANYGKVWYSDLEPYGNYRENVERLIDQAECAVIFLSSGFTEGFLDASGERINCSSYLDARNQEHYECITVHEIIAIERRIQRDPAFRVLTVNLDGYTLNLDEQRVLEKVFRLAGVYTPASVGHFAQCNVNPFYTAKDDEEEFFARWAESVYPIAFYQQRAVQGNFYFGGRQTSVDILLWDTDRGIAASDISFSYLPEPPGFYDRVRRARSEEICHGSQNDDMISVVRYACALTDNDERKQITIHYAQIKYELFFKCLKLWDSSSRFNMSKMLAEYDPEEMLYQIPNAIGMALMVVTADGKLIFSRRSKERKVRSGEYDCSIVEGMKPAAEDYEIGDEDYMERECRRAFQEEICADDSGLEIRVNGLILDKAYGQWNFVGTLFTPKTAAELRELHPLRKDTFERIQLEYVPYLTPTGERTLAFLREKVSQYRKEGLWGTALAVLYAALRCVGFTGQELAEF